MDMLPAVTSRSWRPPGLTLQGWVTALGGVLWGGVAWLTGQRDLIWPGLFLMALPVVSWLLLAVGGRSPRIQRQVAPTEVTAGGEVTSRITVEATGLGLGATATYRDSYPPALRGPAETSLPLSVGRHRMEHRVIADWRGRHRLGPLRWSVTDALGLARAERLLPSDAEVLALPQVHPLEPLRAASGLGSASDASVLKTSLVGTDDVLVREYLPGDDVRRIHWRSTARIGELMVRREEQAWDPSAVLLLDNRADAFAPGDVAVATVPADTSPARPEWGPPRSDQPDPRFEWLVSTAASVAAHLVEHGFTVALCDTDSDAEPGGTSRLGARAAQRRLAELKLSPHDSLEPALAASPTGARGQLLIALLGRLDAADAAALAAARRDHQACWALLLEPAAIDADAVRLLEMVGWRTLRAGAGMSVTTAWHLLGEAVR